MARNADAAEVAASTLQSGPAEGQQLFGVFDLARDARLQPTLLRHPADVCCLEATRLEAKVKARAPYLARAGKNSRLLPDLARAGWGDSWGIYGACPGKLALEGLRRHLFELLRVELPDGRRAIFRFYDPRVLRAFLPTCDAEQLREIFGPISDFWMEAADARTMLHFHLERGRLEQRSISLLG